MPLSSYIRGLSSYGPTEGVWFWGWARRRPLKSDFGAGLPWTVGLRRSHQNHEHPQNEKRPTKAVSESLKKFLPLELGCLALWRTKTAGGISAIPEPWKRQFLHPRSFGGWLPFGKVAHLRWSQALPRRGQGLGRGRKINGLIIPIKFVSIHILRRPRSPWPNGPSQDRKLTSRVEDLQPGEWFLARQKAEKYDGFICVNVGYNYT